MKQLIYLLTMSIILWGCTAETAPPASPPADAAQPPGALATVAPTETAVPPTHTPESDMHEEETSPTSEPVSPVEVDLSKLTPQSPVQTTPIEQPQPGAPTTTTALVNRLAQDLAQRLSIDVQEVTLEKIEEVTWPDGALGCPAPGMAYITVLIPGYQVTLAAKGERYDYHAAENGDFVLCSEKGEPIPHE